MKDILLESINSFPGYKAGSDGNIYSFRVGGKSGGYIDETRVPKLIGSNPTTTSKYLYVQIRKNHRTYNRSVSRLVCEAFNGNCPNGHDVSHLDGNMYNNNPKNLIWENRSDNLKRRILHGTDDNGIRNSRALFNLDQIVEIRKSISEGIKLRDIAKIFGCDERAIGKIKRGERYSRS